MTSRIASTTGVKRRAPRKGRKREGNLLFVWLADLRIGGGTYPGLPVHREGSQMSERGEYQARVMFSRLGREHYEELDAVMCEMDDLRPHGNPRQSFFASVCPTTAARAVLRAGGSVSSAGSPCPTFLAPATAPILPARPGAAFDGHKRPAARLSRDDGPVPSAVPQSAPANAFAGPGQLPPVGRAGAVSFFYGI
jgi:hypothetical protein